MKTPKCPNCGSVHVTDVHCSVVIYSAEREPGTKYPDTTNGYHRFFCVNCSYWITIPFTYGEPELLMKNGDGDGDTTNGDRQGRVQDTEDTELKTFSLKNKTKGGSV